MRIVEYRYQKWIAERLGPTTIVYPDRFSLCRLLVRLTACILPVISPLSHSLPLYYTPHHTTKVPTFLSPTLRTSSMDDPVEPPADGSARPSLDSLEGGSLPPRPTRVA